MYVLDAFDTVFDNFEKHAENLADELIPFFFSALVGAIVFLIIIRIGQVLVHRAERAVLVAGGDLGSSRLVGKVVFYLGVTIGFAVFLGFLGVREAAIAAVLGVGAVVVTISLQDLLRSLVAGVYVAVERPFHIGSRVRIGDQVGTVEDIGVRVTRMRDDEGNSVFVPNMVFFTSPVIRIDTVETDRPQSAP